MKRILFAAAMLVLQQSFAIQKTWVGGDGDNWTNNAAWSPVGVPGTNDDVVFNTNAYVFFSANVTGVRSLTITNDATVLFESAGVYSLGSVVGAPLIVDLGSTLQIRGSSTANSGINLQLDGQSTINGLVDLLGGANSRLTLNSSIVSTARLTVNGKIRTGAIVIGSSPVDAGALSGTSTAAGITFNSGSEYEIARNSGIVGLPQARWAPDAVLKITGAASPAGFQLALNGATPHRLGTVIWNCPLQQAPCSFGFGSFPAVDTIKGEFSVLSTGGNILRFTSSNSSSFSTVFKDDVTVNTPGVVFEMFSSTATSGSANGTWTFEKNVSILPPLGMGNNVSNQHLFRFTGSATGVGSTGPQNVGMNLPNTGQINFLVNNNENGIRLSGNIGGIRDLNVQSGKILLGEYNFSAGLNDGLVNIAFPSWIVTDSTGLFTLPVPVTGRIFPIGVDETSYDQVNIVPAAAGNFSVRVDNALSVAPLQPDWVWNRQWYVSSNVSSANFTFSPDQAAATPPAVSGNDVVAKLDNGAWVETAAPGYSAGFTTPYTSYAVGVEGGFVVNTTVTYTFNGNGNWSDPANWVNNTVPPATVGSNGRVVVDPDPAGSCILDVPVTFTQGATLTVNEGKKFVVNGNLTVQ